MRATDHCPSPLVGATLVSYSPHNLVAGLRQQILHIRTVFFLVPPLTLLGELEKWVYFRAA